MAVVTPYFKIDGVPINIPSELTVDYQTIVTDDSERALSGLMHVDGLANKMVVTLRYDTRTIEEIRPIHDKTWRAYRANKQKIKQTIEFVDVFGDTYNLNTYFTAYGITSGTTDWGNQRISGFEVQFVER